MASMFFGQYLLAKGVIARDALLDGLRRQRVCNLTLAEIGVREGMLNEKQAYVITTSYRTSAASLEEVCTSTGYLTREQVDQLLILQKKEHLLIGDALILGGYLDAEQVERLVIEFKAEERLEQQRLEADFEGFEEKEAVTTSFNLTAFHFKRIANRACKLKSVGDAQGGELATGALRFAQRIVGDREFCIAVDFPEVLATEVAQGLLGLENLDLDSSRDAVCEFVNLIAGNACTHLETSGYRLHPEPPFISGIDGPIQPDGRSVLASFISEDADFNVHLFY